MTNILICDNEGLLIRVIEEVAAWTYTTPNVVTLRAEWDIIKSVILATYKELNMKFIFMHVKSHHQDDDTPTANISLESCLNMEADCLATSYMQEDPM
jgi:hypothetical protein